MKLYISYLSLTISLLSSTSITAGAGLLDSQSSEGRALAAMRANAQRVYDALRSDWHGKREEVMRPIREISTTNNATLSFLFSATPAAARILAAIIHQPHPDVVTEKHAHELRMQESWRDIIADSRELTDRSITNLRRASMTNGIGIDQLMKQDEAIQDLVMRLLTIASQNAATNRGLPAGQE